MLLQLEASQLAPHGAQLRNDQVGLDSYRPALLARWGDILRNGSLRGRELVAGSWSGNGAGRGFFALLRRGWRARRLLVPLPPVEQQKHREGEHEKQYEALRVHVCAVPAHPPGC